MKLKSQSRQKNKQKSHSAESTFSNLELFRVIYPFLKPYLPKMLMLMSLLPLASFAFAMQPTIIQKAIDGPLSTLSSLQKLSAENMNELNFFVLILIVAIVVHSAIQIFQAFAINILGQRMIADIRLKLFKHLEKLPMSFFDRNPIGRSVTRITNDVENLAESFAGGLITTIADMLNIIAIVAFMLYLNWMLCITLLMFLYPMLLMARYFQRQYRRSNLKARKELSKLNSFLQQNIVGISVVQLLNSLKKNMRIFDDYNREYFKANDDSIKADSSFSAGIELVSLWAIAVLVLISYWIIQKDALSVGIVIAFLQYTQILFEPIRNLSDRFTIIQSGFTALERMQHLLNEPLIIDDATNARNIKVKRGLADSKEARLGNKSIVVRKDELILDPTKITIEFDNVWFAYESGQWILEGLSFKINPGETVAIVGKTGAGKSTIIKLLSRLYEPQKGSIKINDVDIREIKQNDLRELMAIIHQDSYIFAGDIESNIVLGRDLNKINMDLAKPFLESFTLDLHDELSERAANISAGEEQVISFARAVVNNPPIVVLDEATAKIDLKTEKIIQESLDKFVQDKTCIIIAHRLETIKKANRVLVIDRGSLVKEGI